MDFSKPQYPAATTACNSIYSHVSRLLPKQSIRLVELSFLQTDSGLNDKTDPRSVRLCADTARGRRCFGGMGLEDATLSRFRIGWLMQVQVKNEVDTALRRM